MSAPNHAILLAAGLGTRMRPLTADTPKPLLELGGRSLLDRALDRLADAGIDKVLVNAHWRAEQIQEHLKRRLGPPDTELLQEIELLDTGGTAAAALTNGRLPGDAPFFVVNGDSVWFDGPISALRRLADGFDMQRLDGMLLLVSATQIQAETRAGDFLLDPLGVLRRPNEREIAPFVFAGVQILSPQLFEDAPAPPLSMNSLWDKAMAAGRLGAIVHDGVFYHLSTPHDLEEAEHGIEDRLAGYVS